MINQKYENAAMNKSALKEMNVDASKNTYRKKQHICLEYNPRK